MTNTKDMDAQQGWTIAKERLRLQLSGPSFDAWLGRASLIAYENNVFTIGIPSKLARDWLEKRYAGVIRETLSTVMASETCVAFVVSEGDFPKVGREAAPSGGEGTSAFPRESGAPQAAQLNPRFHFRNFVAGPNSRFAHAAALAVANRPARAYNPLFLYGGVGLGKTHLLHAIGHSVNEKYPGSKIAYLTSEEFMNAMIQTLHTGDSDTFRRQYRTVDVLLIDDIQFLAGNERLQEEFFHTFNALYDLEHQIVISSDRPPKEIPTLEERLSSRFESGLIADIQPPDFETRMAILKAKIQQHGRGLWSDAGRLLAEEVLTSVAERIQRSVRELEGALIRLLADAALRRQPVTVEAAETLLRDVLPASRSWPVSPENIARTVARFYHVSLDDMKGRRRDKQVLVPRQVAMYLIRDETGASLPEIGQTFGGRDHATVIHAYEKISRDSQESPRLQFDLRKLREIIHSN